MIPKFSSYHIVCYAHFSVVICTVIPGPYKTDSKNTANWGTFISVWAATSRREVKSSSLLGDSDAICMTVKNLLINLWFGFCNQNLSQVAVTVPHALMVGNISQEDPCRLSHFDDPSYRYMHLPFATGRQASNTQSIFKNVSVFRRILKWCRCILAKVHI